MPVYIKVRYNTLRVICPVTQPLNHLTFRAILTHLIALPVAPCDHLRFLNHFQIVLSGNFTY